MRNKEDFPAPFNPKTPIFAPGKMTKKYFLKSLVSVAPLCPPDSWYKRIAPYFFI
jgi:hypothetical protein